MGKVFDALSWHPDGPSPSETGALTVAGALRGSPDGGPMPGWNLRCCRCGTYGARWTPLPRSRSQQVALCAEHSSALLELARRHDAEMREATLEFYAQPDRGTIDVLARPPKLNAEQRAALRALRDQPARPDGVHEQRRLARLASRGMCRRHDGRFEITGRGRATLASLEQHESR